MSLVRPLWQSAYGTSAVVGDVPINIECPNGMLVQIDCTTSGGTVSDVSVVYTPRIYGGIRKRSYDRAFQETGATLPRG